MAGPWALLSVATLLVAVNAFFVAAEFALVRVRTTRLEELAGQGYAAAKTTILLVDRMKLSLTTIQVGVTIASLGVGWCGEEGLWRLLAATSPSVDSGPLRGLAVAGSFALVTLVHVVLGEMIPKNLAIDRADRLALLVARPLFVVSRVLAPVVWLLTTLTAGVLRVCGHRTQPAASVTEDELRLILRDSHADGVITAGEAKIIHSAFELADRTVRAAMVAANAVEYLSLARTVDENLAIASRSLHARLPLCRTELDSVIAIVHMKDAWPLLVEDHSNGALERVARPLLRLAPETPSDQALAAMQRAGTHMAVVGMKKVAGIITMEDLLEGLLGDVREAKPRSVTTPPPSGRHRG